MTGFWLVTVDDGDSKEGKVDQKQNIGLHDAILILQSGVDCC